MKFQPLDRVALTVSLFLTIAILFLLWQGDKTVPRVREFSWHNQEINATDRMFMITFSRPMNQASVESNLKITPKLSGKFSWAGRRMAFTLTEPIPYGQKFNLSLTNATDRFDQPDVFLTFNSQFSSPDRAFVYIGTRGEEAGRLVLHNFTQNYHKILTPNYQIVTDFRIYPDRGHILYSAMPRQAQANILDQELFRVTTGIGNNLGQVELVLDNKEYQIFKFDLSGDGKKIVVQRLSRSVQGSYGLWQIVDDKLTSLSQPPGGDFIIAPDHNSLAITQGEGVAILSLEEGAEPLDFLPKFGNILSFNQDGSQAAMIKFNKDFTRSLFLVNNQGKEQELITINGSFLDSKFSFNGNLLYVLLTRVEQTPTTYQEHPYLGVIDIVAQKFSKLLDLTGQREVTVSLAPDNQAVLLSSKQSPIYQFTPGALEPLKPLDWWGKKPTWLP
jgi:hypothetical protein